MRGAALALMLVLAACSAQPAGETPEPAATASLAVPVPSPSPSPSSTPSSTARDYTPPVLTPEAEKSETGARSLLLAWADAMEDRAFDAAYRVFGEYAERTGQTATRYAATFADYRTVTVAVGDGVGEGAAGSIYYEVPITLTGTTFAGKRYERRGTITVRRVNDVDGASPAQLRWHLDRLAWSD
jgi:hypothetical protein